MSAKKKKKSIWKSRFYRVYFALVAVALVGIAAGTVWLRGLLRDYEAAQPVHVAKEVAALFENADYDALYAVDTAAPALSGGDKAFYVKSLTELTRGGDVAWSEAFSASEDERKYSVTLNGERFATFTLVPSGQTDRRGNRLWTLGGVTTAVTLREPDPEPEPEATAEPEKTWQCHLTAPEGYAIAVDGEPLDLEGAKVGEKALFEDGFLPVGVPNPVIVEYQFAATSVTPAITAADDTGAAATVNLSADKALTWEVPLREEAGYRDQFTGAALALGKRVAKFISRDSGKQAIQKICAPGSPAETIFENLSNTFTTPHTGVDIRNEAASQFYKLSDDCFTCHVTFDYVLYTKDGERVYPTAYTFCVIQQDGKGWLYNMLSF